MISVYTVSNLNRLENRQNHCYSIFIDNLLCIRMMFVYFYRSAGMLAPFFGFYNNVLKRKLYFDVEISKKNQRDLEPICLNILLTVLKYNLKVITTL
jgi:hypothetical protein